jgi:hypothetical protein
LYCPQNDKYERVNENRVDGDQNRGDEPQRESTSADTRRTMLVREVPYLRQIGVARDEGTCEANQIGTVHTATSLEASTKLLSATTESLAFADHPRC